MRGSRKAWESPGLREKPPRGDWGPCFSVEQSLLAQCTPPPDRDNCCGVRDGAPDADV